MNIIIEWVGGARGHSADSFLLYECASVTATPVPNSVLFPPVHLGLKELIPEDSLTMFDENELEVCKI